MSCMIPYKKVTTSRGSRACCALLTSDSTTIPGANYFVKYVLRVVQHLCTPCNACVTGNCKYMTKLRSVTPPWPRGGLRRTACTCPSRVTYTLRGLALRAVCGGSALVPRAELRVQHILNVRQHLCKIFVSLLSTMCHAAFVPQSIPGTPQPPHRVRPHVVLRRHEGPECGGGFPSEAVDMHVCNVRVARVSRVASSCAADDCTPSLQPGTMPAESPAWKKCMIKRRRAIIGF